MISPSVASMLYEKRAKELGGHLTPGAHVAALDYVAKEMGCTRAEALAAGAHLKLAGKAGRE